MVPTHCRLATRRSRRPSRGHRLIITAATTMVRPNPPTPLPARRRHRPVPRRHPVRRVRLGVHTDEVAHAGLVVSHRTAMHPSLRLGRPTADHFGNRVAEEFQSGSRQAARRSSSSPLSRTFTVKPRCSPPKRRRRRPPVPNPATHRRSGRRRWRPRDPGPPAHDGPALSKSAPGYSSG